MLLSAATVLTSAEDIFVIPTENWGKDANGIWRINNANDFIAFAVNAEVNNWYNGETVALNTDLDMTGVEWTPIENFGNYTFDGDKENGYYIKGLSAPLFAITEAKIKDLKLVDVDMTVSITSTDNNSCGAIAILVDPLPGKTRFPIFYATRRKKSAPILKEFEKLHGYGYYD